MIIDFENNNNEIEQEYKNGLTYKEIEKKHEITHEQLKYLIKKNNWKRDSNRSKVQKGNQNAKGNKGGRAPKKNKNALITGEYERIYKDVLDEDEIEIFNNYKSKDKKEEIIEEIKILTIRERRMLSRIAKLKNSDKDLTIQSITRNKSSTSEFGGMSSESSSTFAESTVEKIQRIEESLTKVQDTKRKYIETLHKIENDNRKMELDLIRLEKETLKDAENDNENIKDDSFIKALENNAESAWSDYEE